VKLKKITPRAKMLWIDKKVILFSPYFSLTPLSSSWVIDTHEEDEFFKKLKEDIDHLLKKSIDHENNPTSPNSE
jgi:hypothetical protein